MTDLADECLRITRIIDATATPEGLTANPDNPVEMRRTLAMAKTELAAAREALAPFAHAWSKKMELIADTKVEVFVDPIRPEKTRSIVLGDLQRAARAYQSMTVGVELLERLYAAEAILRKLIELFKGANEGGAERGVGWRIEVLSRLANLSNESTQHLARLGPPAPNTPDEPEDP